MLSQVGRWPMLYHPVVVMKFIVDGDVFGWQKTGGISRIYQEMLPLIGGKPELDISIALDAPLPDFIGSRINRSRILSLPMTWRPWRIWSHLSPSINKFLKDVFWRTRSADVFLSTYFTSPRISCPKICVVYDMIAEMFGHLFTPEWTEFQLERKKTAISRADMLICISRSTMTDLLRIYGVDRQICRVVYLAGFSSRDTNTVGMEFSKNRQGFLLYVGDYRSGYKNFGFMLKTVTGSQSLGGYDLVVVSTSIPTKDEVRRFSDVSGGRCIRFENDCDDNKLKGLYSSCEVFIYPSLYEGFGIPVLEALGCGAPVICSNTSSLPEVGGDAVYYFDPRSENEFHTAMGKALGDGRRDDLVKKRKEQAAKFSWDRTAEGFLDVIKEAATMGGKR